MTTGHREEPWSRRQLTIGQVLDELRQEFPDVSSSKVRFLEAQGLLTPERTAAGYRLFTTEDVARLRYILTAQRDRFWPLKVIREALDALDRGLTDGGGSDDRPSPPLPSSGSEVPDAEAFRPAARVRLTGPELRQASGIDKPIFAALESFGLIQADKSGHFPGEAVDVAIAAHRLAGHGLEARHLRPFRTAADREIGLVEQVLATRRAGGSREERAAEIVAACVALHVALVKSGLNR
jgi:DNA-binding transcriptional MerR regulator